MPNTVCFDQPYEVAVFKCSNLNDASTIKYIHFIDKPIHVDIVETGGSRRLSFELSWDSPICLKNSNVSCITLKRDADTYIALVNKPIGDDYIDIQLLDIRTFKYDGNGGITIKCVKPTPYILSKNIIKQLEIEYDRAVNSTSIYKAIMDMRESPIMISPRIDYTKFYARKKLPSEIGETMIKNVPVITRCIINDPAVVVFWSDGTKTIGKCIDNDEFNPEIGLSMAISRKYYELIGFPNPRSAFKNQLKIAEDHSAKTKEHRDRKQKLLPEAKKTAND